MVKKELIKRSPLRLLEKSIQGGVGKGNIGVVFSKKGVGKTACLVHIATDKLLQEKHVIHVSFSSRTDHIVTWYENIFSEMSKRKDLESAMSVHDEIIKNRVIMNFNQDGVSVDHILDSLKAMINGGRFNSDVIVVDGLDLNKFSVEGLKRVKDYAKEIGVEVWLSCSVAENFVLNSDGMPEELGKYNDLISVAMSLKNENGAIKLSLVKDHDVYPSDKFNLILDAKSMLIAEK